MSENLITRTVSGFVTGHDGWQILREAAESAAALPEGKIVLKLESWQAFKGELAERAARGEIGVWLSADEEPQALAEDFSRLGLIAVDFPIFRDGRGYSTAVLLRTRLGWKGPLRAIGDVLRDQLLHMVRCGFDSYALRPDQDARAALTAFNEMSIRYQGTVLDPLPLFRRERAQAAAGAQA
ncbi:MAG: DUF934 domain-containing protein [Candidatus Protistobacter heckmanni]|nr:DUF934 domain-containing protein [Candidatus Protistobacter heckmanni]